MKRTEGTEISRLTNRFATNNEKLSIHNFKPDVNKLRKIGNTKILKNILTRDNRIVPD